MDTNTKKHNFGAGPCILPQAVLEKAAAAVLNWNCSGLSILEVSHRSKEFEQVMGETEDLVRELLDVPSDYEVLFMQGGASSQFAIVPMNLLFYSHKSKAAYLDTGYFASKAIAQARRYGEVQIVASSREKEYSYIPENYSVDHGCAYLHLTSNNTIEGTQIKTFKDFGIPIVCDMSSDIFSRKIDVSKFDLIYAGAQKNMGPAGMTLVIVRQRLLQKIKEKAPEMWDYRVMAENDSMYNTPPVYPIFVSMLNLQWLKSMGGVSEIEKRNEKKAELLYNAIDNSKLFYGMADKKHRSMMNVTFKCHDQRHEEAFMSYATSLGIVGIKGYRTVGGFRASLYNGLPLESVEHLVRAIKYYEKQLELKAIHNNKTVSA